MLLDEAISSCSYFKKTLKKICLVLIKIFQVETINFISITNQETTEIKNYISKK